MSKNNVSIRSIFETLKEEVVEGSQVVKEESGKIFEQ